MIKYLKKIELNYNNYKVNEKKNKRWKKMDEHRFSSIEIKQYELFIY